MTPQTPNPTSVVLWESSSSLEHSCWACPNKSNSPKALHTCYGIHSMPCYAYHSTMHAVGAAHRCSACISGREVHDTRHREIAQLLADYRAAQIKPEDRYVGSRTLRERPLNLPGGHHPAVIEFQRADQEEETDNEENVSVVDTASTVTNSDDLGIVKDSKAQRRQRKRAIKAQKSQDKAARNQAKTCVQVSSADVERVNLVLHGEQADDQALTHPLATDKTIEQVIARNKGFSKQQQGHIRALYEQVAEGRKEAKARQQHKRRLSEGLIEDAVLEPVINAILVELGIDPNLVAQVPLYPRPRAHHHEIGHRKQKECRKSAPKSSVANSSPKARASGEQGRTTKEQHAIVQRLKEAVKDDLGKHENELRQTYLRAGSFFRYAGRQVFERMTEIASRIDVKTGEAWDKKLKREQDLDLVAIGDLNLEEAEEAEE